MKRDLVAKHREDTIPRGFGFAVFRAGDGQWHVAHPDHDPVVVGCERLRDGRQCHRLHSGFVHGRYFN